MADGLKIDGIGSLVDTTGVDKPGLRKLASSESASESGIDFSSILAEAGKNITNSMQQAEAKSIAGMNNEASAYEVASSIMDAEQKLRMAVSIRDKIIAAYLEISRMQI